MASHEETTEDATATREDRTEGNDWLSSVRSVTDGAILIVLGKLVINGSKFLLNLLLANALGVSLYGVYSYGLRIVRSVQVFTSLGTDLALTRFLSANLDDQAHQNWVLTTSYLTTLAGSLLVGGALFLAAPIIDAHTFDNPQFPTVLRIFAGALLFIAMTRLVTNAFRGLEMPAHQTAMRVLNPVIQLAVVGGVIVLGYSLIGVTAGFLIAAILTLVVGAVGLLATTELRPGWGGSRADYKEFYNYSIPLTLSRGGAVLFDRVDVFMVGFFLGSSAVGIYTISILLASVLIIPLSGFNQLFPPVASRLYADGDEETLEQVYASVTRWAITASLLLALALLVYRREALAIFGEEFTQGATVLSLFLVGQFVNVLVGPSNDLLTMTDHQYVVMVNHWTFGILNVAMNYVFIQEFGLIGAALATASILAALNLLRLIEVWYFEGFLPYSRRLWKPAAAAVCALLVMVGSSLVLSGLPLLVVGSALATLVYGSLLYLFGIEPRDLELARDYLSVLD